MAQEHVNPGDPVRQPLCSRVIIATGIDKRNLDEAKEFEYRREDICWYPAGKENFGNAQSCQC